MSTTIQDGSGKGYQAKVDETNRLSIRGVTEDIQLESTVNGDNYFVGTPFLTQTSATENGLLFFTSSEDFSLFAKTFSSEARYSTGGTFQNYLINIYIGIPESSLTGSWIDFTPPNLNFGSSKTLAGTFKYGNPAGATGFSGSPKIQLAFPINVYNQVATNLIVQKGQTVLLTVTPPTSNTSMPVQFGLAIGLLKNI
jgi:hypothetical protein